MPENEPRNTHDEDPHNMLFRSGFLLGLAERETLQVTDEERDMLRRAGRSLKLAAERLLREWPK